MTEEEKDCEGLMYLRWSQFDSPDSKGSGKKFMDRETVLLLDRVVHKTKMVLDIRTGYTTPKYASIMGLTTSDPHRIGKAVRIRILNPKKRMRLAKALIEEGVTRIALGREVLYYDTDMQQRQKEWLALWD